MGYKPVPYARPLECWVKDCHICVRWYDGSVLELSTSYPKTIEPQVNDFNGQWAKWLLVDSEGNQVIGNYLGTYLVIRPSDGTLLSCGRWDAGLAPGYVDCGYDGGYVCALSTHDRRTIIFPTRAKVFRCNTPIKQLDTDKSLIFGSAVGETKPVVFTERGMLDFETDGVWVSPPVRTRPDYTFPMELRDQSFWSSLRR